TLFPYTTLFRSIVNGYAQLIGGQQVARELHPLERQAQRLGERMGQRGFAHPRNVLDQQMAARQQAGQAQPYLTVLSQNHLVDLRKNGSDLALRCVHGSAAVCSAVTRAICAVNCLSSMRSSDSRMRSFSTTSAGALRAKSALSSLPVSLPRSVSALRRRLASRSSSACGSISPAIGTNISSVPKSATAEMGAASPSARIRCGM